MALDQILTDSFEPSITNFRNKKDYEASKNLIETRSESQQPYKKIKQVSSVWDIEPIDFSVKLYHPKPPKRNSREAIKPWTYDKYLRPYDFELLKRNYESSKNSVEKVVLNDFISSSSNLTTSNDKLENDFQTSFRIPTPNGARMQASKSMSFREGLDQFQNPKPHDFRGLKPLYGAADFKTRFDKDPFNIKFLSGSLRKIHGLENGLSLREIDEGLQMGDLVKQADPHYDPNLILPRLPFPNKYNSYTRFRRRDRSVQSALWDRILPKLQQKLNDETFKSNKTNLT